MELGRGYTGAFLPSRIDGRHADVVKVNNLNLGSEITTPPYRISWYALSTPNGPHKITAVVRDAAGNVTISPAVTVTLGN